MHLGGLGGLLHHLFYFLDAAHDGGELDEVGAGGFRDDFGESGFAHAGRSPEDHGAEFALALAVAFDLHAKGLAGCQQVLLPAVFVEGAGAHALGQRRSWRGMLRGFGGALWGTFELTVEEAHLWLPRPCGGQTTGRMQWTER